jgi:hypothetical protein
MFVQVGKGEISAVATEHDFASMKVYASWVNRPNDTKRGQTLFCSNMMWLPCSTKQVRSMSPPDTYPARVKQRISHAFTLSNV